MLHTALLLLAAVLRFVALGEEVRFHPDEALFATFARGAAVQGAWMLPGALDKPPLAIYAQAAALMLWGVQPLPDGVLTLEVRQGEFAIRVLGTFLSLMTVAALGSLTRRLYPHCSDRLSTLALLIASLSPLLIVFSPTGFTDGLLLLCGVLALRCAAAGGWMWAGVWLGLALWSKQQAVFMLPLAMALGWSATPSADWRTRFWQIMRCGLPVILGIISLALWDAARAMETSLWNLAFANNQPGRLTTWDALLPRLVTWLQDGQFMFGEGWIALLSVGVIGTGLYIHGRQRAAGWRLDALLMLFVIGYTGLHILFINLYDRYWLLLIPALVLLLARGIYALANRWTYRRWVPLIVIVLLLPGALAASALRLPIGGDQRQHQGIEQVAHYLDTRTLGAIIYDRWLGWELGYYLGTWSDKRRVYFPTVAALVQGALEQRDPAARYWVAPDWEDSRKWLAGLAQIGFRMELVYAREPFRVWRLRPPWADDLTRQ
jgi:hypothetical protein